jgi:hypothetical protein
MPYSSTMKEQLTIELLVLENIVNADSLSESQKTLVVG